MNVGIKEQFNLIAQEYDVNRRKFIPCFDGFYQGATDFLASCITAPEKIVDLGAGTGLLDYFWYQKYPDAEYLLIDIADEMLDIARKRFQGIGNVAFQTANYFDKLPDNGFDTAISALSIHHLEDGEKEQLFSRIYEALPEGGLFVNYDQFRAGQPELDAWFDRYWEAQLIGSGLTEQDLALWKERRKLDRECSVEKETYMLHVSGFSAVKCIYSCQKFSVIMAVK